MTAIRVRGFDVRFRQIGEAGEFLWLEDENGGPPFITIHRSQIDVPRFEVGKKYRGVGKKYRGRFAGQYLYTVLEASPDGQRAVVRYTGLDGKALYGATLTSPQDFREVTE